VRTTAKFSMAYFGGYVRGSPWRDIPARYGPYTTCVNRFNLWRKAGHWTRIMEAISKNYDKRIQMIDSTVVRVHQTGANGKKKRFYPVVWGDHGVD